MIDPSSSEEESDDDQGRHPRGASLPRRGQAGRAAPSSQVDSPRGVASQHGSPGGLSTSSSAAASVGHHKSGPAAQVAQPEHAAASAPGLDVANHANARNSLSPSTNAAQEATTYGKSAQRPNSPSPSVASEKTEAELQVRFFPLLFLFNNSVQT